MKHLTFTAPLVSNFPFNVVMLNSTIRVDKIKAGIQSCHTQAQ